MQLVKCEKRRRSLVIRTIDVAALQTVAIFLEIGRKEIESSAEGRDKLTGCARFF